jgi:hypothetical protein
VNFVFILLFIYLFFFLVVFLSLRSIALYVVFLDVEYYPMSEMVDTGYKKEYRNASSQEECAKNSFSSMFYCFAATYFPEEKYCIAECTQKTNIPETVTLVNSSVNSTVLLRTHNKGIILRRH